MKPGCAEMSELQGARIHITGIVQGVGFRPFVYNLAERYQLAGWVRNTSAGVDIEVDGLPELISGFVQSLRAEAPILARIDNLVVEYCPPNGFTSFNIIHSAPIPEAFQPISPDVCICPDCLRELFDPADRRYRYPFINCTNCGPRFTIIKDIPYDRPNTTMAGFAMCAECAAEYENPRDRRFHAQPIACPVCGPQVWLEASHPGVWVESDFNNILEIDDEGKFPRLAVGDHALLVVQRLLAEGAIVAIKGLGGFHLACDATNKQAVSEMRARKLRVDKPFAVMMADLDTIRQHCYVDDTEAELLLSRQRPIVILRRRPASNIAAEVAPSQQTLGVMLPYTPLHYLLFAAPENHSNPGVSGNSSTIVTPALVMTSGNLSEEPIATDNQEARQRLSGLADYFLMHNRPIYTRCDDSVTRVVSSQRLPLYHLRRSRGYAPSPIDLPLDSPPLLAGGAELKNTFCLTRERYAFLSHHIGDLENYETLRAFEQGIRHYERLFHVTPVAFAYDLHPNYLATRYILARAREERLPAMGIQHHHAHIAACLADNHAAVDETVLGVAFDGTGYGDDGAIWGGEFLLANYTGYKRVAHLDYIPLPGGDAAIRKPARIALAHFWQAGIEWEAQLPPVAALCAEERAALRLQLERQINTIQTSSMGRLFDAVASLAGVRQNINYEAQAAIELEALVDTEETGEYSFDLSRINAEASQPVWSIGCKSLLLQVTTDVLNRVPASVIAARFHASVAHLVCQLALQVRAAYGISTVALSGGVWQNQVLLTRSISLLEREGFKIYLHQQTPANDGGISLGQAVIAAARLNASPS